MIRTGGFEPAPVPFRKGQGIIHPKPFREGPHRSGYLSPTPSPSRSSGPAGSRSPFLHPSVRFHQAPVPPFPRSPLPHLAVRGYLYLVLPVPLSWPCSPGFCQVPPPVRSRLSYLLVGHGQVHIRRVPPRPHRHYHMSWMSRATRSTHRDRCSVFFCHARRSSFHPSFF